MKQRDKTNLRKCFIVACTIQDLVNGVCGEKRVKKTSLQSSAQNQIFLIFSPTTSGFSFLIFSAASAL